jgi:hypothetical protein
VIVLIALASEPGDELPGLLIEHLHIGMAASVASRFPFESKAKYSTYLNCPSPDPSEPMFMTCSNSIASPADTTPRIKRPIIDEIKLF